MSIKEDAVNNPSNKTSHLPKHFYHWRLVLVSFLIMFVYGSQIYSYGVFLKPISTELDISIAVMSTISAASFFALGALAPLIGRLVDVYPVKRLLYIGVICTAAGYLIMAVAQQTWQLLFAKALLMSIGAAFAGTMPIYKIITAWFTKRKGLAIGIVGVGLSAAGVLVPIISAKGIDLFGWRTTLMYMGVIAALAPLFLILFFVQVRPSEQGLLAYGDSYDDDSDVNTEGSPSSGRVSNEGAEKSNLSTGDNNKLPFKVILNNRNFWFVSIPFGVGLSLLTALFTHIVSFAEGRGISGIEAAGLISIIAGAAMVGKVTHGWLDDKLSLKVLLIICFAIQGVGFTGINLAGDHYWWLILSLAIWGFGAGGVTPLMALTAVALHGPKYFGSTFGSIRACSLPLAAGGTIFAGRMYDVYGNYDLAFYCFLGVSVMAGLLLLFIQPDKLVEK